MNKDVGIRVIGIEIEAWQMLSHGVAFMNDSKDPPILIGFGNMVLSRPEIADAQSGQLPVRGRTHRDFLRQISTCQLLASKIGQVRKSKYPLTAVALRPRLRV